MTQSAPSSPSAADRTPDDELIESCIQLLKDNYPRGMTIKEMAQELLQESLPEHLQAICRSSTVLSTKLNSFYRRCHPDYRSSIHSKYPTCPIVRQVCPNTPNRLQYMYVTEQQQREQQAELAKRPISPPPASDSSDSDEMGILTLPPSMSGGKKAPVTRPLSPPPGPDSPPSSGGHYMLRKVIKKTPHAYTPPISKRKGSLSAIPRRRSVLNSSMSPPPSKSPELVDDKRPNPYYEAISIAVGDASYSKPWLQDAKWEEIHHPELLSLSDLDSLLT